MARTKQVNKADIEFDTAYLYRETDLDGDEHVFANVGYRVATAEGESWGRDLERFEVTTRVAALFAAITTHIKTEEGIV